MGDLTFSKNFGCVAKGEHRFIPDVVLDSTKFVYVVGNFPALYARMNWPLKYWIIGLVLALYRTGPPSPRHELGITPLHEERKGQQSLHQVR